MKQVSSTILGYICGFCYTTLFCGHYLVAQEVLRQVDTFALSSLRGLLGGILLYLVFKGKAFIPIDIKVIKFMLLMGLCSFGLNQILFLEGLKRSAPLNAAIIVNLLPLITGGWAIVLRLEKVRLGYLGALGFAFLVLAVYHIASATSAVQGHAQGDLLILASVALMSFSFVWAKKKSVSASPYTNDLAYAYLRWGVACLFWVLGLALGLEFCLAIYSKCGPDDLRGDFFELSCLWT